MTKRRENIVLLELNSDFAIRQLYWVLKRVSNQREVKTYIFLESAMQSLPRCKLSLRKELHVYNLLYTE